MQHTTGLVSDKSNQKFLVSLFDVLAVRFSLTMQALEAKEEHRAAGRSEEGNKSCYKHLRATSILCTSPFSNTKGMKG